MLDMIVSALSPMGAMWLAATLVFAAVEAATVSLVSIWFAGGALVAMVAAGLRAPLWVQIVLFLVVSVALLALLGPMARKASRRNVVPTNADRHIGQTALVTEEINNLQETGTIRMDGVTWTARSESGEVIPVGTRIRVKRIAGVKAYVEREAVAP